ncbi:hypothetical protein [Lignipirellula cremea]|uniref:Uncharacterized protein n=1 Tax=Lignipirellula cremea TaxID=2528010 RepID=A0A518DV92_9BACT|nr:hypothetical protein [Lignipirellula cremea]QDU95755.1 hypothetical protein Pla8534_35720 [Lignipirellula cremea]
MRRFYWQLFTGALACAIAWGSVAPSRSSAAPAAGAALRMLHDGAEDSATDDAAPAIGPAVPAANSAPAYEPRGGSFQPTAAVIGAGLKPEEPALTGPFLGSARGETSFRDPAFGVPASGRPVVGSRWQSEQAAPGDVEPGGRFVPGQAPDNPMGASPPPPMPGADPADKPETPSVLPKLTLPAPRPRPVKPSASESPADPGKNFVPSTQPALPTPAVPNGKDFLPMTPPAVPPAPENPPEGTELESLPPVEPTPDSDSGMSDAERAEAAIQGAPLKPLSSPVVDGDFPALPPDPNADEEEKDNLPPLGEELWDHGGSYMYAPEGDHLNWPDGKFGPHAEAIDEAHGPGSHTGHQSEQACHPGEEGHGHHESHYDYLRLPEGWIGPQPLTIGPQFLGVGPIIPWGHWPGVGGYDLEPRFVGAGSFRLFGFGLNENNQEQAGVGGHLILDLDLRLTGTERFHVQYRPFGRRGTGGSYYQFTDPSGVVNNATAQPDLYWFEGELGSMFGAYFSPFVASDITVTVGRFPFLLHNTYLINDEFVGVVLNKNNIELGGLSNLNLQFFYAFQDVSAYSDADSQLYGVHATADYRNQLYEATYAFVQHEFNSRRDSHYLGLSRTQFIGNYTVAGRLLGKLGDQDGRGDGVLGVIETNTNRVFDQKPLGIEHGVYYCNVFAASRGWSSIGGGGFNRLTTAFETNPLIRISAGRPVSETVGVALGVQFFRLHEDESFVPEVAFESRDGQGVFGAGLRYLRKTGQRSFFEALGVINVSNDERFQRSGLFLSETILF